MSHASFVCEYVGGPHCGKQFRRVTPIDKDFVHVKGRKKAPNSMTGFVHFVDIYFAEFIDDDGIVKLVHNHREMRCAFGNDQ